MNKKAQLNISFAWLFAFIVGAAILAITIFAVVKIIGIGEKSSDVTTGKEVGILLNPLETGFESGKSTSMILSGETRIYNKCQSEIGFGRQILDLSQQSFGKWTETESDIGFTNRYIFSENYSQGKTFYLFSKPFEFPFKVSDLIYLTSAEDKYCFVNAPEEVVEEIESLQQENLLVNNCSEKKDVKNVCFGISENCYAFVEYGSGYVKKGSDKLYFEGDALMYAAIFSDSEIYECQLQRLLVRLISLAEIYKSKAEFIQRVGCSTNVDLKGLIDLAEKVGESSQLSLMTEKVEEIEQKNKYNSDCKLW